jgi:hypothetical protein
MTIHLIQAGFGGWGRGWLNNILQCDLDVKLVAGVDISSEALQDLHDIHKHRFLHAPSPALPNNRYH